MTDLTSGPEVVLDLEGPSVEVLQTVWKQTLDIDEVDPDAGFFDLGATSAMILGVVHVLRQRWPHLRAVDIFSHPTVSQLSVFLDDE